MTDPTRALRGWALGSPLPITRRRPLDPDGLMCPCRYSTPYLHSLTMTLFHWPAPILHNETVAEYINSDDPDMLREFGFGHIAHLRGAARSNPASLPERNFSYRNVGPKGYFPRSYWRGSLNDGGGFFTYNPAHIERMGRWSECDVIGVVRLFGEIAVHERGYRAMGVKIERLWVLWEASQRFKKDSVHEFLTNTYDCEVTILQKRLYDGFAQWVKKENIQNLSEL